MYDAFAFKHERMSSVYQGDWDIRVEPTSSVLTVTRLIVATGFLARRCR